MAEKRRDSKGRILRTGESQRKDGRYAYKYTDSTGKPQFVYAWKLVATDKTPAGKRDDISLREKEKEINRDIADGIDTVGKKMTVCQLYAKQNSQRADVKRGTKKQREYLMGLLRDDPLGSKSIRPLAKLGKAVNIADASNQRKAKSETASAVAVAFREDTKPFDKADSVFHKDTLL